jgi:hypothetical protein
MAASGYSGTPLVRKLGIKPDSTLALVRAPAGFRKLLRGMPDGVRIAAAATPGTAASADLTIWFVLRGGDLEAHIGLVAGSMGQGLWVAWPKKASGVTTDLTENRVRDAGLAHGLVDYKVCAIDETWSGLKFARRRA